MYPVSRKDVHRAFGEGSFPGIKEFFLTAQRDGEGFVFPLHGKIGNDTKVLVKVYSKKKIRKMTGYES